MNSNAAHSHTISDPGHYHDRIYLNQGSAGSGNGAAWNQLPIQNAVHDNGSGSRTSSNATGITGTNSTNIDHTHSFSTTSGAASADHTHTYSGTTDNGSSQTNWQPRYIDMILCSKN
jgi:hypothetical protein